ncbi:uncharacterized protein [Physcomitrium patens]|uniref:uncharacterized protein isoform X2 n=1 Tax=Physcomitrium patens TaxID=3218 RepID=UPI00024AC24B|nr:uncharacterized protein LOC112290750 isoform X2 [Physcomitrium patens]|eukprot:XP_024393163.1 uncharacterized protein LOC112290750 isoform X2 [Physcomitrella patens]
MAGSVRRRVVFQEPRHLLHTQDYKNTNLQDMESDAFRALDRVTSSSGNAEATYTVQLTTSNEDRASLSITNACIMLLLIGEGGEALMQRILPVQDSVANSASLRFQRGSVDEVNFRGPNLGRISALWIAPESGTWRLEQATVTMMPCGGPEESGLDAQKGFFHVFNGRDILMGDGEDHSAVELKPAQVLECNGSEDSAILAVKVPIEARKTPQESARLRKASMREYESLKLLLLGSTAGMVGVGTLGLYLLGVPDMAQAFAVGGAGGLLYLLLIQRAVDQIPSPDQPESLKSNGTFSSLKVKSPAATFALIVGLALVVTRASQASAVISISPPELLAGSLGFLTSKIAVLLAAFTPTKAEKNPE